jgi:hypothetical protein
MLNGDAHHSKRRDGELRIGRCRVFKDSNAQSIPEHGYLIIRFSVYASRVFKHPSLVYEAIPVAIHWRRPAFDEVAPAATSEA